MLYTKLLRMLRGPGGRNDQFKRNSRDAAPRHVRDLTWTSPTPLHDCLDSGAFNTLSFTCTSRSFGYPSALTFLCYYRCPGWHRSPWLFSTLFIRCSFGCDPYARVGRTNAFRWSSMRNGARHQNIWGLFLLTMPVSTIMNGWRKCWLNAFDRRWAARRWQALSS